MIDLFTTEVGSRMWRMDKPDSDYDLFVVYMQSYREYMRKGSFVNTLPHKQYMEDGKEIDAQYIEIGHLVSLLKKGNVNAIWGVCSPIVRVDHPILQSLRYILLGNLSKETYASVNGMAHSQMNDTKKRENVRVPGKESCDGCANTAIWHYFAQIWHRYVQSGLQRNSG